MIKQGISNGLSRGVRTGAPRLFVVGNAFNEKAKDFLLRADATGESRPVAFDLPLNALIQGLIDDECFHTQFDALVNTRGGIGIGTATSKLNLVKNDHNALGVNGPTYVAGIGYNSDGSSSYINSQYKPASSGVLYTINNACFGFKVSGTIKAGLGGHGVFHNTPQRVTAMFNTVNAARLNSYSGLGVSYAIGYNNLSRFDANKFYQYVNANSTTCNDGSNYLPDKNVFLLAPNISDGTPAPYYCANTEKLELYWIGGSLIQAKFLKLQSRFNTFWAAVC